MLTAFDNSLDTIVAIRKAVRAAGNPDLTNKIDAIIAAGTDLFGDDIAPEHTIWQSVSPAGWQFANA